MGNDIALARLSSIEPLVPIKDDTPNPATGRDHAKNGFNQTRLENLVRDCEDQPTNWREQADVCNAYVDGKQLTAIQHSTLVAEGMRDVKAINLVGRVVRGTLGQEAKSRTDPHVSADGDDFMDVSDVFNRKLLEAKRETYADMAVSQGYSGQVISGVGWVEVGRNADPLDYPYRVEDVHRAEMWFPLRDRDLLLRKTRWLARVQWKDIDELEAVMPQHRRLLRSVSSGWNNSLADNGPFDTDYTIEDAYRAEQRWASYHRRSDWWESTRRRVKMYEIWYRVPAMGVVLHWSRTKRCLFDPASRLHEMAIASGRVKVTKEVTTQVRMSLYAGPHRLFDVGTRKRNFPYVPFFAYRDDEDGSPYGLVEGMIAPQDEYNARRLRINWLLRARQVLVDNDALDLKVNSLADILDTVMRPDFVAVLRGDRKNQNGLQVLQNLSLQKEQLEVMADAKQLIQDVPGVYGSQLGQQSSGVTSGIANSLLIEQGAVAMGDLNDNYRMARRMVFENLLDLIVEDHLEADLRETIGVGESKRIVVLNSFDEAGNVINDVREAPMRVGLGEVPSTPAFRMQQQQQIATIATSLAQINPQAAALVAPAFFESTDLPNRKELADDMRRALGIPTAEDRKAQEQQRQQQQAEQQRQQHLTAQIQDTAVRKGLAEVDELESSAELNRAKAAEIGHEMGMAEIAHSAGRDDAIASRAAEAVDPAELAQQQAIEDSIAEAMPVA